MTDEDSLALISNPEAYSFRSDTTVSHIRVAMMMFVCLRNGVVDPEDLKTKPADPIVAGDHERGAIATKSVDLGAELGRIYFGVAGEDWWVL